MSIELTLGSAFLYEIALVIGVIVLAAGALWWSVSMRNDHKLGAGLAVIVGLVITVVSIWGFVAAPTASNAVVATCGPGSNPYVACPTPHSAIASVTPTALTGAVWYQNGIGGSDIPTYFVGSVFNRTSSLFDTAASNTSTPGTNTEIKIPITLTRTDTGNSTFAFTVTVSAIPTVFSTGSSPILVSPLAGYNTGGTAAQQYQIKFINGTLSGYLPTGAAPGASTNLITNQLNIAAGGSLTTTLEQELGGAVFSGTAQVFPYSAFLASIGASGTAAFTETITLGPGATFYGGATTIQVELWVYGSITG